MGFHFSVGQFLIAKDRDTYSNRAATYNLIQQSCLETANSYSALSVIVQ